MTSKNRICSLSLLIGLILFISNCKTVVEDESKYSGDLFSESIRSTEPRTAQEEMAGFKLPPGFEIQLFASEPNIDKPINMTFDAKGRMWVTQSFEYPFPNAPGEHGTDRLTILEDTDHDGIADTFTDVSDTLNIPVGILPVTGGFVNFSVPNLYKFSDANGDAKPEDKKVLIGPFGFQDTHGMVSNFIRGYDGWVYACHGFTNYSKIAGADGDSITLVSGNTFRFRLDGSRVEQMTFGQVNPFGLAYDENGYIYSTDSHSSPLYQLIRGGDYPHFSKQEIMAFGPDMKSFENEATALCGIAYYDDTKFPKEFQGNFFIGDAVSSRVHRYTWENKGSSPVGKSETDFIKSADPWFRPVNVKMGPDGALYIADFYNAIIGHYEAPLGHPKRDKERGRIWRITYKGEQNNTVDLTTASLDDLLKALDVDNLTARMAAADQVADRIGVSSVESLKSLLATEGISSRKYVHALWLLYRLNAITEEILNKSIAQSSPQIRLHTLRILREWKSRPETFHPIILAAVKDFDPHLERAAVELLMEYHDMSTVEAVLSVLNSAPNTDTHLMYTSRLCLRNVLRNNGVMKEVGEKKWSDKDAGFIAGTLVDVASTDAAIFLANYLESHAMQKGKTRLAYQQVARYIPADELESAITRAKGRRSDDVDLNTQVFHGIKNGLEQRGTNSKQIEPWAAEIAGWVLKKYPADYDSVSDNIIEQQSFAIQLAGDFKVHSLQPVLTKFVESHTSNINLKSSALSSLMKISGSSTIELAGKILMNDSTPIDFKKRIVNILGESPNTEFNSVLMKVKKAPADLEAFIVAALSHSLDGKDIALKQVRDGSFMTRTLIDPRVEESMLANISVKQKKEYDAIISTIEPVDNDRQALIDRRLAAFKNFKTTNAITLDSGSMVFNANCNSCHRKYTMSGIGPQLHGIGKRGAEALAEKILDPNRNISEAFRNYTITLKDGKVTTGLYRREEGAVVIFGDLTGKEFSIPKKNIVTQTPSRYTIMPDHFGTTLSQQEFNLLVNYLLTW